jgi:5-(carboxyamino)imidazole ribonucleotide mutase
VRILAAGDDRLRAEVERFQRDLEESVLARDAALQERLGR